jgi:hypothetical protein
MSNHRIIFLIVTIIAIQTCFAQKIDRAQINNIDLSFSKYINYWYWRGGIYLQSINSGGINFSINDRFSSNLLLPSSNEQEWRDENNLTMFFYKRSDHLNYGIFTKSWLLADQIPDARSYNGNHIIGFKSDCFFDKNIEVNPYLGYQRSENKSIIDYGWNIGLNGKVYHYLVGNYKGDLNIENNYDLYENRQNRYNNFAVNIKTKLSEIVSDSVSLNYTRDFKQYYLQVEKDSFFLNDLLMNYRSLHNYLNYRLSRNSQFNINTTIESKNIIDDNPVDRNKRNILRFENYFYYQYLLSNIFVLFGVHMYSENQDNLGFQTDNISKQTAFRTYFSYDFNKNNKFEFKFDYIKFQYDTPDTITNHEDRDEQRFIGTLKYYHYFSPILAMNLEFYSNFFHRMYISEERSSNNNWNRIYGLGSEVRYNNNNWKNILKSQILTNYTIYDFEEIFPAIHSFIFRKYVISDSLNIPFCQNIIFGLHIRIELEDKGQFFKKEFAQKVLHSTKSNYYDFFLKSEKIFLFDLNFGINFYRRLDWQHVPAKMQIRNIYSYSPYIRLLYFLSKNIRFTSYLARTYVVDKMKQQYSYYNDVDKGKHKLSYFNGHLGLNYMF